MFMLPRRGKAFSKDLRFAAMMHQYQGMLFRASHVDVRLIDEHLARSEESAPLVCGATARRQRSRSLTARLTKARRRDSGWQVAGDEVFFTLSS